MPVTELRAGVIIGSGSASFEMLRYLVEVLPVMVTPKWVSTRCQPIGVADVIDLLVRATGQVDGPSACYEVGGPDVVTYAQMMATFAEVAGLRRRWLLPVPLLTPRLSSLWVGLVTPVPVPLARELVESLVNEVVVEEGRSGCDAFSVSPTGLRQAIVEALAAGDGSSPPAPTTTERSAFHPIATDPAWSGGTVLRDVRWRRVAATPTTLFDTLTEIGGAKGWYAGQWLWWVRGRLDQLVGGPGLRRGRGPTLAVGDPLDFWRVEDLVPGRRLRLRAEMRLPGDAWLTWDIAPDGPGRGSPRRQCSARGGCWDGSTGPRWPRSTGSSSPACSTDWRPTPNGGAGSRRPAPNGWGPPYARASSGR